MLDKLPELIDKIDMAGFGQLGWDELIADLGNRVPGSFLAMFGTDPHNLRNQQVVVHRLDPSLIQSYATHYHAINPWNRLWQDPVPVKSTLQLMPSSSLRHCEFVQDYLRAAGQFRRWKSGTRRRRTCAPHDGIIRKAKLPGFSKELFGNYQIMER